MELSETLGPAGIESRMSAIEAQMNARLGLSPAKAPVGSSFASQLKAQLAQSQGTPTRAPSSLRPLIESAAAQNSIDPDLLDCLVHQESGYNPDSRSPVGAMGLTQLMPGTAIGLGVTDPYDPVQNLNGGAKYLREQLDKFGNIPQALAAYNAGPGAVIRSNGIPNYPETQNYVSTIMARYNALKSGAESPTIKGTGLGDAGLVKVYGGGL